MSAAPPRQTRDAGSDIIGKFKVGMEIGKGSFATVYRGKNIETKELVAIKAVLWSKLNRKLLENLESEISILKNVNHPHVVGLIDCQKNQKFIHLIMDYCSLGDLSQFIKRRERLSQNPATAAIARKYPSVPGGGLNEVVARHFIQQLSSALKFLHAKNLIHRDVKPQNLLLDPPPGDQFEEVSGYVGLRSLPTLKLADFGFARILPSTALADTLCGSPLYMAPEILRYEKYDGKVDLWSTGAVSYEMLVGRPPYSATNHVELLRRIESSDDRVEFPDRISVGEDLKALVRRLLKRNPVERASFEEFFDSPVLSGSIPGAAKETTNTASPIAVAAPRETVKHAVSAPTIVPAGAYIEAQRQERELPTLPIAESQAPAALPINRPPDIRRQTAPQARELPTRDIPQPKEERRGSFRDRQRPSALKNVAEHRTREEIEIDKAVSTPLRETVEPTPEEIAARKRKDRERQLRETRREEQLEQEYVIVSKQKVEVNALADEIAASPRTGTVGRSPPAGSPIPRRTPSGSGKELANRARTNNAYQFARSPSERPKVSPKSKSVLAKALRIANNRLFAGFIGESSPPQPTSPFPAYPMTNYHNGSMIVVCGTSLGKDDAAIVQNIENLANRSDVVYHFAAIKFHQLLPTDKISSAISPNGTPPISHPQQSVSPTNSFNDDLSAEAVVTLAEEALVLYVKVLDLLDKAMEAAGAWWHAAEARTNDPVNPQTHARINNVVQWIRQRFNEALDKAQIAQMKLQEAQQNLPDWHPSHPSKRRQHSSSSSTDVVVSANASSEEIPLTPGITAEKLMFDRATEMSKQAAINELMNEDLEGCRVAYAASARMLEALLDVEEDQVFTEDRAHILTLIAQIKERGDALAKKSTAFNTQAQMQLVGGPGSKSPKVGSVESMRVGSVGR